MLDVFVLCLASEKTQEKLGKHREYENETITYGVSSIMIAFIGCLRDLNPGLLF